MFVLGALASFAFGAYSFSAQEPSTLFEKCPKVNLKQASLVECMLATNVDPTLVNVLVNVCESKLFCIFIFSRVLVSQVERGPPSEAEMSGLLSRHSLEHAVEP